MKRLKYLFCGILASYFPALLFCAALMPTDGGFMPWNYPLNFLVVFLVSLPYAVLFLQSGLFLSCFLVRKDGKKYRKVMRTVGLLAALCSSACATVTFITDATVSPIAIWSLLLPIALWAVEAVTRTFKREKPSFTADLRWKSFLLCTLTVLLVACLSVFAAFQISVYREKKKAEPYTSQFEVWHNTPTVICKRGERGEIVVHLKSNADYTYTGASSDFRPRVYLFLENSNPRYYIALDELPSTDDIGTFTVYAGEVRDITFYFTVPDDAPLGSYDIEMRYRYSSNTQKGVLLIVE